MDMTGRLLTYGGYLAQAKNLVMLLTLKYQMARYSFITLSMALGNLLGLNDYLIATTTPPRLMFAAPTA